MRPILRALPFFAGLALSASDPSAVLASARQAWPDKAGFAVVCDYGMSREAVGAAAQAAAENGYRTVTVVDVRRLANIGPALAYLASHKADLVLLLPKDPLVGDGRFGATALLKGLNSYSIPACATTRVALDQGATLVQGEGTDGELLVNSKLKGTIQYEFVPPPRSSRLGGGVQPAAIRLVSLR